MKYITILFVCLYLLGACRKMNTEPEIIVEPPEPIEVKLDSIQEGEMYNVKIGDPTEKVYADLRFFAKGVQQKPYLAITGFLNDHIENLEGRIPLYGSLIFDQRPSSKNGGQIYFEGNNIKSIYKREGKKLTKWPQGSPSALQVGDRITDIYAKLIKINNDKRFRSLFDYIGMFEKNLETDYDPLQEKSDLWQFNFSIDEKQVVRLDLVFEEGRLVMVRSRYERYL
ncbi:hypothetical protein FXV77_20430 [Sphingobacterium phlebotomi]|uniref:Lipoprotein n=1 Tax=Sphingobacterium phlebotomi TaxID=2605433 RepID=A0A5D4GUW1_9SPHI|nr:hypothetical protein [Sphingobacterium phlebotomi]TYR31802.1 hypothetical protein FXV77_20430 [Sphingobacterium phlebotomi]